jgi:hypothetical protein
MFAVYSKNRMKHKYTFCGHDVELHNVKAHCTYSRLRVLKCSHSELFSVKRQKSNVTVFSRVFSD